MTLKLDQTPEEELLRQIAEYERKDRAEAVTGIQRGFDAFAQGRFRRFSEFEAEKRTKYNLSTLFDNFNGNMH